MVSVQCAVAELDLGEVFRLDAKAEGETVAIGGWRCRGTDRAKEAPWFAVSLTRRNAPWDFQKGEAFRTIASLEFLGVLVGLMVLTPERGLEKGDLSGVVAVSCGTDNLGNTFLLDRGLTTKYPLGVILMEVAHQCRRRGLALRANWILRLENQGAGDLTNLEFKSLDAKNRIQVDLDKLEFGVLRDLFEVGDAYVQEIDDLKKEAKEEAGGEAHEEKEACG